MFRRTRTAGRNCCSDTRLANVVPQAEQSRPKVQFGSAGCEVGYVVEIAAVLRSLHRIQPKVPPYSDEIRHSITRKAKPKSTK